MRSVFTLLICTLLATLGLSACSSPNSTDAPNRPSTSTSSGQPEVVATFTILADMAQTIAGDTLTVTSLAQPGDEVHHFDPSPRDVAAAERAELILSNGLNLETWTQAITDSSPARHVVVSEGIDPIPIAGTTSPNPHAWMSPQLGARYIDRISDALIALRPEHAALYERNAQAYKDQLAEVEAHLTDALARIPAMHRTLVTCEGAFSYLARDADLTEGYLWPVNAEEGVSPRQISDTIDLVKARRVPAVFCESTVPHGGQEEVMRATGAANGGTLYVDSLSGPEGPVPTYLDLIRHDVDTIVAGLSGNAPDSSTH